MEESPAGGDGGFLAALPVSAADELRRLGARRRFPAGATLFFEGDPAHEALVLLSGAVKVSVGSAGCGAGSATSWSSGQATPWAGLPYASWSGSTSPAGHSW